MDLKNKTSTSITSMSQKIQELTLLVIEYRKEIDEEREKIRRDIKTIREMIEKLSQK